MYMSSETLNSTHSLYCGVLILCEYISLLHIEFMLCCVLCTVLIDRFAQTVFQFLATCLSSLQEFLLFLLYTVLSSSRHVCSNIFEVPCSVAG